MPNSEQYQLSEVVIQARELYDRKLRALLEPEHAGESLAVHVDSGDYAVGSTRRAAADALMKRREADGRIVTMTIGPPTDADLRFASRIIAARKR